MPRQSKKQERLQQVQDFLTEKVEDLDENQVAKIELSTIVGEVDDLYQSSFYSYGGGKWLDANLEGVTYRNNTGKLLIEVGDFLSQR